MDGFDIHDPESRRLVLPNAPLVKLGDGLAWWEGPAWFADQDCLLVSDLPNDRILCWSEGGGMSLLRQPSGFANGHTRDRKGRLLGCSHQHRCITRTELDGSITVLASHHEGRRLNGPNDTICQSNGTIWLTDPHYGGNTDFEGGKHRCELPPALYSLDPRSGSLQVMAADFEGPNRLRFSPDERRHYVAETGRQFAENPVQHIRVFDVSDDAARLSGGQVFHTVSPGYADGFRCDVVGRIWSSAGDGVHCSAPDGRLLGRIKVPFTESNLEFGGRNLAPLFICASHTLCAIYTNTRGTRRLPEPARAI